MYILPVDVRFKPPYSHVYIVLASAAVSGELRHDVGDIGPRGVAATASRANIVVVHEVDTACVLVSALELSLETDRAYCLRSGSAF